MNLTRKNTSFPIYVGPLDYFTRACFLKSTTSRNRLIMPLRPSDCIMHLITSSFLSFCVVSLICHSRVAWWQVSDAVTMVTYLVRGCRGFKRTHFLLTLSFQFLDLVLTFLYIYWIDFLIRWYQMFGIGEHWIVEYSYWCRSGEQKVPLNIPSHF